MHFVSQTEPKIKAKVERWPALTGGRGRRTIASLEAYACAGVLQRPGGQDQEGHEEQNAIVDELRVARAEVKFVLQDQGDDRHTSKRA